MTDGVFLLIEDGGDFVKSVIISETEPITLGDSWVNIKDTTLGIRTASEHDVTTITSKGYHTHCKKVIVLPEHLSAEYLQAIEDGEYTPNQKVVVACEEVEDKSWYLPVQYYVKLNSEGHVTFLPIDNEEPTYTTDEVKELIRQAYVDGYENGYVKGVWYDKIEKFYKEHLKKKPHGHQS